MNDVRERIRAEMVRPIVVGSRKAIRVMMAYLGTLLPVYWLGAAPGRGPRVLATLLAVGVLGGCHWALGGAPRGRESVQRILALGMGALLGQILTNMVVLQRPQLTSDLMLWMVGCGLVFRSRAWLGAALGVALLAWGLVFHALPAGELGLHWPIGLATALVVSAVIHLHVSGIERAQEDLRVQDRIRERTNEQLIEMLGDSLEKIKTLRGLIPICAQCKKVRNDQGFWQQVEHYLADHSGAEFTHGVCPDCAERFRQELRGH